MEIPSVGEEVIGCQFLCCPRNGRCARAYQLAAAAWRFAPSCSPATVSASSREGDTPDPTSPETGLGRWPDAAGRGAKPVCPPHSVRNPDQACGDVGREENHETLHCRDLRRGCRTACTRSKSGATSRYRHCNPSTSSSVSNAATRQGHHGRRHRSSWSAIHR